MQKRLRRTRRLIASLPTAVLAAVLLGTPASAITTSYIRLIGTATYDRAMDVTGQGSTTFVTGSTQASLAGQPYLGQEDIYVRALDSSGSTLRTREFGTTDEDFAYAIAADETGVYVSGFTLGDLHGTPLGSRDAIIRKYDLNGNVRWTKQFGTDQYDEAGGIATEGNGVFVVGYTDGDFAKNQIGLGDVFVRRYSRSGSVVWTKQFGTAAFDQANSVDGRKGKIFITGDTQGDLAGAKGQQDGFVRVLDTDGAHQWTKQFGSDDNDYSEEVSSSSAGPVVAGYTYGDLGGTNAGSYDGFAKAFDPDGKNRWVHLVGTTASDYSEGVLTLPGGGALMGGTTGGTLPGEATAGGDDVFMQQLDGTGSATDTVQLGGPGADQGEEIGGDSVMVGVVTGTVGGQPFSGSADGLVWKVT